MMQIIQLISDVDINNVGTKSCFSLSEFLELMASIKQLKVDVDEKTREQTAADLRNGMLDKIR